MSERRMVKVEVECDYMPLRLVDAAKWINEVLNQIPPEHRGSATLATFPDATYDNELSVWCSFSRAETDQELSQRVESERREKKAWEKRERRQLEKLMQKYGVKA